jgi:hypothetical protein
MNSKSIVIEETNKDLSANGGLLFFDALFNKLDLNSSLAPILPKKQKDRGILQIHKIKSLLFHFASGNDCLDDLDEARQESLFSELSAGGVSSRSMGDFLRSFSNVSLLEIADRLVDLSLKMRLAMHPDDLDFVLSMDSTPHEQTGKQMEGVSWNYKKMWCLDSLNAYDQYGFSYGFDLRPGNTFSAEESELMVRRIFKKLPRNMRRYFRADSAYGRKSLYDELINANVNFAIVLRENIGRFVRKMSMNKHSMKWYKTGINFFDSDQCEVSSGLYPIKDLAGGKSHLRVGFIRTKKENVQLDLLEDIAEDGYYYYSIITNMESSEMSNEEVIEFYRGRANAENFIKEQKNGYDFHHFPCKKLSANQAYGLVGTIAYNMMRFLSFFISNQGCFSKRVRNKLIKLPCQVVRHARQLTVLFSHKTKEAIEKILEDMNTIFCKVVYNSST